MIFQQVVTSNPEVSVWKKDLKPLLYLSIASAVISARLKIRKWLPRSAHISCLYYLYLSDHITATVLCGHCEEDKATISRALDYLETNGYLICEAKSSKRYNSPLILTRKGQEVGEKIAHKIDSALAEITVEFTEEERIGFYRYLSAISSQLEAFADTCGKTNLPDASSGHQKIGD